MGNLLRNRLFISTRPEGQSDELEQLLVAEGARFISMPTIEIQPALLSGEEKETYEKLTDYNWLVFTSPNGIRYFFAGLFELQNNYELPRTLKIAVVGKKTAMQLECYGHEAALISAGNTGEDMAAELLNEMKWGDRILLVVGNLARNVVEEHLAAKAVCERFVVYHTVFPKHIDQQTLDLITNGKYDMVILTSPSGFRNLLVALNGDTDLTQLRLACIGATTANEVAEYGLQPLVTAQTASSQGIYSSILKYFQKTTIQKH